MRTTVTIDDGLLAEAKSLAARSNRSLSEVVDDALRVFFARRHSTNTDGAVVLPSFGDPAGAPLVDILDKNALADALGDERP